LGRNTFPAMGSAESASRVLQRNSIQILQN